MESSFDLAALDGFYDQVASEVLAASQSWANDVQAAMRQQAPWTDRGGLHSLTGKTARESLEAEAVPTDDGAVEIIARSTRQSDTPWREWNGAPVGMFLELGTRFMTPRAVIWPVLSAMAPDLPRRVMNSLGDGWTLGTGTEGE